MCKQDRCVVFSIYSFSCEFVDVEQFPASDANMTFRQLVVECHVLKIKTDILDMLQLLGSRKDFSIVYCNL